MHLLIQATLMLFSPAFVIVLQLAASLIPLQESTFNILQMWQDAIASFISTLIFTTLAKLQFLLLVVTAIHTMEPPIPQADYIRTPFQLLLVVIVLFTWILQ